MVNIPPTNINLVNELKESIQIVLKVDKERIVSVKLYGSYQKLIKKISKVDGCMNLSEANLFQCVCNDNYFRTELYDKRRWTDYVPDGWG